MRCWKETSILKAVALCMLLASSASRSDNDIDSAERYQLNVQSQTVEQALRSLANASSRQLLFPYDQMEALKSVSISGRYTLKEALGIILKDTSLSGELTTEGVILVTPIQKKSDRGSEMKNRKNLLASTIAFFVGAGGVSAVVGEEVEEKDSGWALEEIVVTAQKREQRLVDVPISITAFNERAIRSSGIQDISDLSYLVPNLNISDVAQNLRTISIRGVGNAVGNSPLVGVYLDEIPVGVGPTVLNIDIQTIDIMRVEVLKGPQGSLYGQGSVGGVVRYVANRPSLNEFNGEIGLSYYDTQSGSGSEERSAVVNIPIIKDVFGVRIAGVYKDVGGWFDKVDESGNMIDKNFNNNQLSSVRLKGLMELASDFDLEFTAVRHRSDSGGPKYSNTGELSNSRYRVFNRNDLGVTPTEAPYDYDIYNVTINYDFGLANLVSSSSYYSIDTFYPTSFQMANDLYIGALNSGDVLAQEIRLSGTLNDDIDWIVGGSYTELDRDTISDLQFYLDGTQLAGLNLEENVDSKVTAFFVDVSYDFTESFRASFGVRSFNDDRAEVSSLSGGLQSNHRQDFEKISLKGTLSYSIGDHATAYINVSEGFRSGGANSFSDTTYDPETVLSYEVGVKTALLDGRLLFDAALYKADYDDYQALEFDQSTGASVTSNSGEVQIEGFEFAVQFSPVEQFVLGVSGNYTDTEVVEAPPNIPADLSATPPFAGFVSPFDVGDPVNFVAKYSYSITSDYNFNWSSEIEGFAHVDYTRQGPSTYTGRGDEWPPNFDGSVESTAVGFLNANIGATFNPLTIKLFAKNLNNESRATTAGTLIMPQNRPRTIGFDLKYSF